MTARTAFLILISLSAFPTLTLAQSPLVQWAQVTPAERIVASVDLEEGWHPGLKLSGNFSLGSNNNMIGQTDGDTITLGSTIEGNLTYKESRHEWRQKLNLSENTTRTPTLNRYVKSTDEAKYETIYLYGFEQYPWLGPYAKATVDTALFKGEDVRDRPYNYQIRKTNGTVQPSFVASTLRLTDALRPFTTKESVGLFAKLVDDENQKVEIRGGFGALQVETDDQLTVKDDAKTADIIEVEELRSFSQAGTDFGLTWFGNFDERSSYNLGVEVLIPLVKDLPKGDDRSSLELTNLDIKGSLLTKVYDWASISYEFKVKKQPELLDKYQVQHYLVMNFTYSLL